MQGGSRRRDIAHRHRARAAHEHLQQREWEGEGEGVREGDTEVMRWGGLKAEGREGGGHRGNECRVWGAGRAE